MKDSDFSEVHAAQVAAFTSALSMVNPENIKSFGDGDTPQIVDPMLLLEVAELEIDDQKRGAAGKVWVNAQFQAHCILPRSVPLVSVECINFAAVVMKVVNKNKWGLAHVGIPQMLSAAPGRYVKDPKGFDSWVVSWWQTVAIGEGWTINTSAPEKVMLSESPEIGRDHESDYEELQDGFINPTAT